MSRTLGILAWLAVILVPTPAAAFGLKTHIWIGQQIITEVSRSCRIEVGDVPVTLDAALCSSIRNQPQAFLAGTLGPDAYPDLITGQVTTHPGLEDDWSTSDWLVHFYSTAKPGAELAFAAGYLVHAASDVFAHTYVNAYSGDIFMLGDERAVERRHFVLEKYIDARLPGFSVAPDDLRIPTEYLRDRLIFDSSAGRTANKSGVAGHISAMNGVRVSVEHLADQLDDLEEDAGRLLGDYVAKSIDLGAQVNNGEAQLKVAREALALREQQLALLQGALDTAEATFNDAADALQKNQDLINLKSLEAQAAAAAAEAARQAATDGADTLARLRNSLSDLNNQLMTTPSKIAVEQCHNVLVDLGCNWTCLGGIVPFCKNVCKSVNKQVCSLVDAVNNVYTNLVNEVTATEKRITDIQAAVAKAAAETTANVAKEAAALQEKLAAESQRMALQATRDAASAAFEVQRAQFQAEQQLTSTARQTADEAAARLAELRENLLNTDFIRDGIKDLIARSDILSGYAHNWSTGIAVAGREYIETSHRVAIGLLTGESHFVSEYLHWMQCYGSAFTPKPYQVDESICKAVAFYEQLNDEFNQLVERILPPPLSDLHRRLNELKDHLKNQAKRAADDAALQLTKFIAPDGTTGDFIELLARPENATAAKLNEVYRVTGDSAGKDLLVFDAIAQQIDQDIGLEQGVLDPDAFAALKHARTLSKMALLDVAGLRNLVWVLGGNPQQIPDSSVPGRYSALYSMVRSIDGNHQWQRYGLPYARTSGEPTPSSAKERRYGHGTGEPQGGFILFANPQLRQTVFARVFDRPVSGALAHHPRLAAGVYPFPECAAQPFPVAMDDTGAPLPDSSACTSLGASATGVESNNWEWARRLLNRFSLTPN